MYDYYLPMYGHGNTEEEAQDSLKDRYASPKEEEVTYTVELPYSWLLQSIMADICCEIFSSGVQNYGPSMYCAWMDIELPRTTTMGVNERKLLFGDIKDTHEEAVQSCAKKVIRELFEKRNVQVRDVNFSALKKTKRRLVAADLWPEAFQEKTTEVLKIYMQSMTPSTATCMVKSPTSVVNFKMCCLWRPPS